MKAKIVIPISSVHSLFDSVMDQCNSLSAEQTEFRDQLIQFAVALYNRDYKTAAKFYKPIKSDFGPSVNYLLQFGTVVKISKVMGIPRLYLPGYKSGCRAFE